MSLTRRQCLALMCGSRVAAAAASSLEERWRQIARDTDSRVGAAALHLASGEQVTMHAGERFPLASVCKLPIAIHVLALVDSGKMGLHDPIAVLPQDVTRNVSEVGLLWPKQRVFELSRLVEAMVARSDNTAVETLFRIGGGAPAIGERLRQWHIDGIRIDRTERQCGRDAATSMPRFLTDSRDTGTPDGTVQLLKRLYAGELLSRASTARLIQILEATSTGPGRIKGLLPFGAVVAHKTGTTGTVRGLNGSTNDVGVITLPKNAGQLAVAFYLKAGTGDLAGRERLIARLARAAFDSWLERT